MHPNYPTEVNEPAAAPGVAAGIPAPDRDTFGIGARVTLAVMSADYAEIILGSLRKADATGLEVETGDVSTFVAGREPGHAAVSEPAHFGGGPQRCPRCRHRALLSGLSRRSAVRSSGRSRPLRSEIVELEEAGMSAAAEWARTRWRTRAAMAWARTICGTSTPPFDYAKAKGTFVKSEHFVTRLEGDLARILETVAAGWVLVGRTVQHVTSHLTLSLNSPTAR